jgi:hypothetical protein
MMGHNIGIGKRSPTNALVPAPSQKATHAVEVEAEAEIKLTSAGKVEAIANEVELLGTTSIGLKVSVDVPPSKPTAAAGTPPPSPPPPKTTLELEKNSIELKCGEWVVKLDNANDCIKIGKENAYPQITVHERNGITLMLDKDENNCIDLHSNTGLKLRSNGNTLKFTSNCINLNEGAITEKK